MAAMPRSRARAVLLSTCLSLGLAASARASGPEPEPPVEGPRPKPVASEEPPPATADAPAEPQPPAPKLAPVLVPDADAGEPKNSPGIEFAVPPPDEDEERDPDQARREQPLSAQFPDPGVAPPDGVNMLVLGGTTLALTAVGTTAGLLIGLQRGVALEWLLPSTIVPAVGLAVFSGGGLYLGIKRARAYRRWEIGYRVIGLPQGGGLMIGGSFTLLAALGFIPSGAFLIRSDPTWGGVLLGVGVASAIATPMMFSFGVRNQRRYERTGGWKRKPIPPLPPGAATSRLELRPLVLPLPAGAGLGAVGRF